MTEPMTPERLAEIRDRHRPHRLCDDCTYGRPCHARELLAEVDLLRAANSDLEQYVRTYCPTPFEKAEVDRLRAQVADAWDEGYRACLRQWGRMPERNPHHRAALASSDEVQSCQRCGSYSHTSCPVAPWETQ